MKTYEVSSLMYIEIMSCKPTVMTILNSNSLFGFSQISMKSILCWRRRVYAGKKKDYADTGI